MYLSGSKHCYGWQAFKWTQINEDTVYITKTDMYNDDLPHKMLTGFNLPPGTMSLSTVINPSRNRCVFWHE